VNQVVNFVVENVFTLLISHRKSLSHSLSLTTQKTLISQNPSFSPCFNWRLPAPQPEPSPSFEERLDDFAEKVADIDVNLGEGPETLVENVQTTPMQTPSKKTVSKRKISPKQVPKQGPAKDEPEDPSSKEGSTHHFKNWPNFFREVWCGAKL